MAAETLIEDEIRPGCASLAAASLRRDVATRLGDPKQKGGVEVGGGQLGGLARAAAFLPTCPAPDWLCLSNVAYWLKQNSPKRETCQISLHKTYYRASGLRLRRLKACS